MKQKYLVGKGESNAETIIKELAELEKNQFSTICKKTYKTKDLKKAVAAGVDELMLHIRMPDFFPPYHIGEKIVAALEASFSASDDEWVEVEFDELESSREAEAELEDDLDDDLDDLDDDGDIDDLLGDDLEIDASADASADDSTDDDDDDESNG